MTSEAFGDVFILWWKGIQGTGDPIPSTGQRESLKWFTEDEKMMAIKCEFGTQAQT